MKSTTHANVKIKDAWWANMHSLTVTLLTRFNICTCFQSSNKSRIRWRTYRAESAGERGVVGAGVLRCWVGVGSVRDGGKKVITKGGGGGGEWESNPQSYIQSFYIIIKHPWKKSHALIIMGLGWMGNGGGGGLERWRWVWEKCNCRKGWGSFFADIVFPPPNPTPQTVDL